MTYLDHNSTTEINADVKKLVRRLMKRIFNPSSIHKYGREAKGIIENARLQILEALSIKDLNRSHQLIFTSSGTEANNQILNSFQNHEILISSIEHLSIFSHKNHKNNIQLIKVDKNGVLDLVDLENKLFALNSGADRGKPILVSVMLVNNETGVIQPMKSISNIVKKYNAVLHSDIVQAIGKIRVDIEELGIDVATISAHKFGGLIGAAAIITNSETAKYLRPLIIGGGQERGLRSGTENVISIAAMALALQITLNNLERNSRKMQKLQNFLEKNLRERFFYAIIASKDVLRVPNTTLILLPNRDAQTSLIKFDINNVQVSSGSACSSGKISMSHVLAAMQIPEQLARSSIRVSLSPKNTKKDIEIFLKIFEEIY